jgi:hypothetical protein
VDNKAKANKSKINKDKGLGSKVNKATKARASGDPTKVEDRGKEAGETEVNKLRARGVRIKMKMKLTNNVKKVNGRPHKLINGLTNFW